jgi:hypothetical protein
MSLFRRHAGVIHAMICPGEIGSKGFDSLPGGLMIDPACKKGDQR